MSIIINWDIDKEGKLNITHLDVDCGGYDAIDVVSKYENLRDFIEKEFGDELAKQLVIDYGNWIVGLWFCPKCGNKIFPRKLEESNKIPPFICECGELLVYDEEE
jgi:hypothetical protein